MWPEVVMENHTRSSAVHGKSHFKMSQLTCVLPSVAELVLKQTPKRTTVLMQKAPMTIRFLWRLNFHNHEIVVTYLHVASVVENS